VARAALDWGEPVLDSSLTEITERGPALRGQLVVDLVERGVTFEQAAQLLWTGTLPATAPRWAVRTLGFEARRLAALRPDGAPLFATLPLAMAALAASPADGPTLIPRLAASLALSIEPGRATESLGQNGIAATILHALRARPSRTAIRAVDAALVASLDHELNPSTFVARVAAAVGADMPACITAGLATLSGARHGGACDRVEELVEEVGRKDHARRRVEERLRRGQAVPGFGHRLYPQGDPRGALLLDVARSLGRSTRRLETLLALVRVMHDGGQEAPTLDVGLVAITSALGLPRGSAIALFALGRTAGWIAHALEQKASGQVLRPRARYVG
jgi:citrate synthase